MPKAQDGLLFDPAVNDSDAILFNFGLCHLCGATSGLRICGRFSHGLDSSGGGRFRGHSFARAALAAWTAAQAAFEAAKAS
jgi:hypothetical protein